MYLQFSASRLYGFTYSSGASAGDAQATRHTLSQNCAHKSQHRTSTCDRTDRESADEAWGGEDIYLWLQTVCREPVIAFIHTWHAKTRHTAH